MYHNKFFKLNTLHIDIQIVSVSYQRSEWSLVQIAIISRNGMIELSSCYFDVYHLGALSGSPLTYIYFFYFYWVWLSSNVSCVHLAQLDVLLEHASLV